MLSGGSKRILKLAAVAAIGSMILVTAVLVSPVSPGSTEGARASFGPSQALAGDLTGSSAAFSDRLVLGLFSEDVRGTLKAKIPSSQWPYIRNVRIFAKWKMIERTGKGRFSWSGLDAEINSALSLGVNGILLTITGPVPSWAENKSNPSPSYMGPPKRMSDWQSFCRAVAMRYRDYVDWYQIWQEPGWDKASPPAVNEGVVYYGGYCDWSYLGFLRAGYNGIKAADPSSYVIAGSMMNGITRSPGDFSHYETLLAGANQDISMKVTADRDIVAERPMYFNYHGWCPGGTVEQGIKQPGRTWYLAEGATHPGFEEWISIQNPQGRDSKVTITYMFPGGATQTQVVNVKGHSRYTVDVNSAVGPDKNVSARIDSTQAVIVERPMYFNYHGWSQGGSVESGVKSPDTKWYLAEGTTQPGFEQWISLQNPSASPTKVKITYMFQGWGNKVQEFTMPPTSRETVMVNEVVGPNMDVSARVEATQPIIAERPMYFNYHGAWTGGHSQLGSTSTAKSWFLSEGTTRSNPSDGAFEEWISIMNPGNKPATVDLTYMFEGGGTQPGQKVVPPRSRETVMVNEVIGPDMDVSVQLDSDQPIVVERPLYYNYHNTMAGGDVELGMTGAGRTWYFAEGTTRAGFEEWLTLQNPNAEPAKATVTYMFGDATTQTQTVDLPPSSRTTVGVNRSVSMAAVCDAVAVHPYDYPEYWGWYYSQVVGICAKNGWGGREVVVTEIGWPHAGRDEFSEEGQRRAIGEVGVGGLLGAGCKKIWIFQDVDPPESWDDAFNGLFSSSGRAMSAWNEYKKWQSQFPDYGNKPKKLW
jgi:hypothetical protein